MCGEAMPQGMDAGMFGDPGLLHRRSDNFFPFSRESRNISILKFRVLSWWLLEKERNLFTQRV
jgi:hypothetical protein